MKVRAIHVFHDVYMGFSHASLLQIMRDNKVTEPLEKGEIAIFVNASFSAVKLMAGDDTILYHRGISPGTVTPEVIRYLPTLYGGERLVFAGSLEHALIKEFERACGKKHQSRRLKAVGE